MTHRISPQKVRRKSAIGSNRADPAERPEHQKPRFTGTFCHQLIELILSAPIRFNN